MIDHPVQLGEGKLRDLRGSIVHTAMAAGATSGPLSGIPAIATRPSALAGKFVGSRL